MRLLACLAIALALSFGFARVSHALTISPVKLEISGDPGSVVPGSFVLFNEQQESKTLYASTANFEARGESGTPYFLPDTDQGLSSWIRVQETVTLEAGERKTIPFEVRIPAGTEPAGYFAAIFWGNSPPEAQGGGQVAIGGKLGVLILLSVAGDVKQGGGILDFRAEGSRFQSSLPVRLYYRFGNDGTERIKPTGEMTITNLFGTTVATLDANRRDGNVLPGSVRKYEMAWAEKDQKKSDAIPALASDGADAEAAAKPGFFATAKNQWRQFAIGPHTAKLTLAYGKDNKAAEAAYRFFLFPWQLLSVIAVALGVLGFSVKKYNSWIIAQARRK